MNRTANIERKTKETQINLNLNLDGGGRAQINTGIGFFDHMLVSLAKHGFLDLDLTIAGDLQIDGHHSVEDAGIVFGTALKEALGDKAGIRRYGHAILPMDDALVLCAIDLGGRPYFDYDATFSGPSVGALDTGLVREFFHALTYAAAMNLHIKVLSGHNDHHIIEAMFKAFANALSQALSYEPRLTGTLSTKGVLA